MWVNTMNLPKCPEHQQLISNKSTPMKIGMIECSSTYSLPGISETQRVQKQLLIWNFKPYSEIHMILQLYKMGRYMTGSYMINEMVSIFLICSIRRINVHIGANARVHIYQTHFFINFIFQMQTALGH